MYILAIVVAFFAVVIATYLVAIYFMQPGADKKTLWWALGAIAGGAMWVGLTKILDWIFL